MLWLSGVYLVWCLTAYTSGKKVWLVMSLETWMEKSFALVDFIEKCLQLK